MPVKKNVAPHRRGKSRVKRPPHVVEDTIIMERRAKALSLRRAGATYQQIASATGVSIETAYSDVQAELSSLRLQTVEDATAVRELELRRLDDYTRALSARAAQGDIAAITTLLRVQERRSRYLGLDAATKQEIIGDVPAFVIHMEGSSDKDAH